MENKKVYNVLKNIITIVLTVNSCVASQIPNSNRRPRREQNDVVIEQPGNNNIVVLSREDFIAMKNSMEELRSEICKQNKIIEKCKETIKKNEEKNKELREQEVRRLRRTFTNERANLEIATLRNRIRNQTNNLSRGITGLVRTAIGGGVSYFAVSTGVQAGLWIETGLPTYGLTGGTAISQTLTVLGGLGGTLLAGSGVLLLSASIARSIENEKEKEELLRKIREEKEKIEYESEADRKEEII